MRIGVVGLGLIGGSIARGLHQLGHEIFGFDLDSSIQADFQLVSELKDLAVCEILFLCTPMRAMPSCLTELGAILPPEAIVTDVASAKRFLVSPASSYPFRFVAGHPMAGSEKVGFVHSDPTLFQGKRWVLLDGAQKQAREQVSALVESLGAQPILTTAKNHDKAVALVSHLPLVLSCALDDLFQTEAGPVERTLASSGLTGMLRLAQGDKVLLEDLWKYNGDYISEALAQYRARLRDS